MKRSIIDKIISYTGLLLAGIFLAASGVLFFTYQFIHGQVAEQLSTQSIILPAKDSPAFKALPREDQDAIAPFAGQQVTTGQQAEVFANNYIAAHIDTIGDGKTYSELSEESRKNPEDQALSGKVESVFRGETLRGILLNAYAFDTMAVVAKYVAIGALIASVLLLVLSLFGFKHAKKVIQKRK